MDRDGAARTWQHYSTSFWESGPSWHDKALHRFTLRVLLLDSESRRVQENCIDIMILG